jgi:hypothetical protein
MRKNNTFKTVVTLKSSGVNWRTARYTEVAGNVWFLSRQQTKAIGYVRTHSFHGPKMTMYHAPWIMTNMICVTKAII